MVEAQAHFKRGVELYEDNDLAAALVEFRRAYDLVPNYRVLYNLGRVASALHDYATALRHYRQYLAEGGSQVVPSRRLEVEGEIVKLTSRVGQVRVIVESLRSSRQVATGVAPGRSLMGFPLTPVSIFATTANSLSGNTTTVWSNLPPSSKPKETETGIASRLKTSTLRLGKSKAAIRRHLEKLARAEALS